ncbi:MAG TPA: hypothetical protein EYP90_09560 [Chromatiaceae bacterium]|nr:hypothetical protein [Chromatiaceae bacterium]
MRFDIPQRPSGQPAILVLAAAHDEGAGLDDAGDGLAALEDEKDPHKPLEVGLSGVGEELMEEGQ